MGKHDRVVGDVGAQTTHPSEARCVRERLLPHELAGVAIEEGQTAHIFRNPSFQLRVARDHDVPLGGRCNVLRLSSALSVCIRSHVLACTSRPNRLHCLDVDLHGKPIIIVLRVFQDDIGARLHRERDFALVPADANGVTVRTTSGLTVIWN